MRYIKEDKDKIDLKDLSKVKPSISIKKIFFLKISTATTMCNLFLAGTSKITDIENIFNLIEITFCVGLYQAKLGSAIFIAFIRCIQSKS